MDNKRIILGLIGLVLIAFSFFLFPFSYSSMILGTIIDVFCRTVVDFSQNTNRSFLRQNCGYAVDYTVNDKNYTNSFNEKISYMYPPRNKGEQYEVFYNKNNPALSINRQDKNGRTFGGIILFILGLLLLGGAIFGKSSQPVVTTKKEDKQD
jgi:hypothetical protein